MADDALDALPDGAVIADADGVVTTINRVAAKYLGVSAEDAVGRPLADVLALQDQDGNDWFSHNCPYEGLATRTAVPSSPGCCPTAPRCSWWRPAPRRARPAGEPVVVSLRSGRGRARLDRERSDLVATVAHELRSPLTGVKGFVQALLNRWDKLNDDQKKLMLTTVHADSERLSRLIAELLDVARIDTGRLALYPRPSDATVLVTRVVELVRASTSRPIELDAGDDLPQILVDPDKFTQVVTNLVENGIRHGDGTVRVTLAAMNGGDEFEGVRLTVDDEGAGIPPEMRRRVFTKFWKDGTRGGSGLGLYLVNGLVRAHGGSVTIDDAPGDGARVILTWPSEERRPD